MSLNEHDLALARMDDDGFGCAITSPAEPGREWWSTQERLDHEQHVTAPGCRLCTWDRSTGWLSLTRGNGIS